MYFFCSPLAYVDPCHCNMAQVFLELLTDSLNEYGYDAEVAGVDYKLEQTMYGFCVSKGHTKPRVTPLLVPWILGRRLA